MTDEAYNERLCEAFSAVVPDVWEGVYIGGDVDLYITFSYSSLGVMFANNRPTAQKRLVTATLWARRGLRVFRERREMCAAILRLCGRLPERTVATDGAWRQYIFEFETVDGVEEDFGEQKGEKGGMPWRG